MGMLGDGVICLIQAVVFVYDIVTYPLYTAVQRPWGVRENYDKQRAQVVVQDKESIVIKAPHKMTKPLQELVDAGVDTMAKCFKFGLDKHTHKSCLFNALTIDEYI